MIRKFKNEDITQIMTIWTKGNFESNYFIDKDYWLEKFNNVKKQYLSESYIYVYDENNEIKGYVSLLDNGYISDIYIKKQYQRQGIGRRLINYCKERNKKITLHVYERNVQATLFFIAMNFKNQGIQINEETRRKRIYFKMAVKRIKQRKLPFCSRSI